MKIIVAAVLVLSLSACTSLGTPIPGSNNVSVAAERVDGDAAAAYAAVGNAVNAAEAVKPDLTAQGEALRSKAWGYFSAEHKLYQSGIVGDITALQGLVSTAQQLGH